MKHVLLFSVLLLSAGGSVGRAQTQTQTDVTALAGQVRETERAFAKTMADRNHAAFVSFLADDTVFLGDPQTLRGKTPWPRRGRRSTTPRGRRSRGIRIAWKCWTRARSR